MLPNWRMPPLSWFYCFRIEASTIRKLHAFFEMESVGQSIIADVPRFGQPSLKFTISRTTSVS